MGAEKYTFSKKVRKVRFDRKSSSQTSVKSLRGIIRQKVKIFLKFQKTKKLQKVTFAFLHTCTRKMGVWGGQNRKSASWATFRTLERPDRPSRTFSYVYGVFSRSGSPKSTFPTFGAKKRGRSPIGRPRAPKGDGHPATAHRVAGWPSPLGALGRAVESAGRSGPSSEG